MAGYNGKTVRRRAKKRHTATHFYHHHHYYYNHSAGIVIQINMAAAIIAVTAAAVAAPLLFNIGHFLSFSHFLSLSLSFTAIVRKRKGRHKKCSKKLCTSNSHYIDSMCVAQQWEWQWGNSASAPVPTHCSNTLQHTGTPAYIAYILSAKTKRQKNWN